MIMYDMTMEIMAARPDYISLKFIVKCNVYWIFNLILIKIYV